MSINPNKYSKNKYFMSLALNQAQTNLGNTERNPSVGCIIVKNNCAISGGSTSIKGRPHAESNALKDSKTDVENSEIYVTLEPCSHYGITSPCTKKIISKKIKKVFFSVIDPDLRSKYRSIKHFNKAKVKINYGLLNSKIKKFYKSYIKYKENKLPYVTAKIAISKDFFLINKRSKWITNKFSRGRVHLMRSYHNCLVTSYKTIIKDNPMLTCRIDGLYNRSPSRVVIDKELKTPLKSKIIQTAKFYKTIIFFNKFKSKKIKILKKNKVKLIKIKITNGKTFDLREILIKLRSLGYSRILLEAGLNLTTNFLRTGLVDEIRIFKTNKNLGINGKDNFKKNMKFLKRKKCKKEKVNLFDDLLTTYILK